MICFIHATTTVRFFLLIANQMEIKLPLYANSHIHHQWEIRLSSKWNKSTMTSLIIMIIIYRVIFMQREISFVWQISVDKERSITNEQKCAMTNSLVYSSLAMSRIIIFAIAWIYYKFTQCHYFIIIVNPIEVVQLEWYDGLKIRIYCCTASNIQRINLYLYI